ncbi:MAG: patatin-like phospholipase family protein [Gammaproteobacteria bacterium]|nr:patatin-like phospholipase family protein [Gammaproteobacteria bacterium]MDP6674885.1 patatin-like phospholipase family protein [Gammaproteobacteria bacterium]
MNSSTFLPKIGLALGSGASRGWSHIGVIKALLREGIEPDIVCGTSVGAIVGGAYVAGNLEALESWVLGSTRSDVLRFFDISISQAGFVDTKRLGWFLDSYVAKADRNIEDLPKKFGTVSTDLDTGREAWFTEGGLADAVRVSMALPGLFPAVRHKHRWMVDGGLVNPVPVSICRALGADVVIAVNLNSGIIGKHKTEVQEEAPQDNSGVLSNLKQQVKEYSNAFFPGREDKDEPPGLFYAIANSLLIVQDRITRSRLAGDPADVLLSPQLAHIGMMEFHHAAEAIKEGEDCVQKSLAEICRVTGR